MIFLIEKERNETTKFNGAKVEISLSISSNRAKSWKTLKMTYQHPQSSHSCCISTSDYLKQTEVIVGKLISSDLTDIATVKINHLFLSKMVSPLLNSLAPMRKIKWAWIFKSMFEKIQTQ